MEGMYLGPILLHATVNYFAPFETPQICPLFCSRMIVQSVILSSRAKLLSPRQVTSMKTYDHFNMCSSFQSGHGLEDYLHDDVLTYFEHKNAYPTSSSMYSIAENEQNVVHRSKNEEANQSLSSGSKSIPLFISGGVGGPLIIGSLTPLRNALTIASHDRDNNIFQLFRKHVFRFGFRSAWVGGLWPCAPAIPQFLVLGPLYHFYQNIFQTYLGGTGTLSAVIATATTETLLTYGGNARNAQCCFNAHVRSSLRKTNLASIYSPIGPGSTCHILRNCISLCGVRILSNDVNDCLVSYYTRQDKPINFAAVRAGSDFFCAILAGVVSMPFNQLFNFYCTRPDVEGTSFITRINIGKRFLAEQYFIKHPSGSYRLSPVMLRDVLLRSLYAGAVFGSYMTLERSLLRLWE